MYYANKSTYFKAIACLGYYIAAAMMILSSVVKVSANDLNAITTQAALHVTPDHVVIVSGDSPQLIATIRNTTKSPLQFSEFFGWQALGLIPIRAKTGSGKLDRTRYGKELEEEQVAGVLAGSRKAITVPSHGLWALNGGKSFKPLLDYDLTLPGKYKIHFTFNGLSGTISNEINITVKQPYTHVPNKALEKMKRTNRKIPENHARGVQLVMQPNKHDGVPVSFNIYIIVNAQKAVTILLTGNPLLDFRQSSVEGPDHKKLVNAPRRHYITIPNHKSVPMTNFGKQFNSAKRANGILWKKYVLEPRHVYKYTVPVNLGCLYDMSTPGEYHIQMCLAQNNIRSEWMDVQIMRTLSGLELHKHGKDEGHKVQR